MPSSFLLADEETDDSPGPDQAVILFGRNSDFETWKGDHDYWSVQENVIVGKNSSENPLKSHTYLIYDGAEFNDFELTAQFKIEGKGGNSGIQYRGKIVDPARFKVAGYQADIDFDNRYAGIVYEQDGRGILCRRGASITIDKDGKKKSKRMGDTMQMASSIHPGQWNDYRIVAKGPQLEHYINGALMARLTDLETQRAATKGVVALQLHQGPPMTVFFKNIVIRPLRQP